MVTRTIIGNSKYLQRFTGLNAPIIKRPVHDLADGRALLVVVDDNDAGSNYGNKNNQPIIKLMMGDTGRSTWTTVATYTLPAGKFPAAASAHVHCGATLMTDESLFFCWRGDVTGTNKYGLYGCVFTKTSATTWSNPSGFETIFIPSTRYPFRFDLDVNKSNQVIVGWMYSALDSTASPIGYDIYVRAGANNYKVLTGGYGLGSTGNIHPLTGSEDFTLAVDPLSDVTNTRLTFLTAVVGSKKDYGDSLGYRVFRNSDGVTLQAGYIKQGFNAGRGGGRRTSYMWASGNGEFTLVGASGTTTIEAYVARWKTTSALTAAPVYSNTIPVAYNARKPTANRDGSLYSDVSCVYANGRFATIFHDTSAFRDLFGTIINGKVWWDQGLYSWANGGKWVDTSTTYADAPAAAVYGGSRFPNIDGVSTSTALYYYSRTKLTTTDAIVAYHINWTHRAPHSVVPSAGSTVNSGMPVLAIYADLDQPIPRTSIQVRWQIAKDSGFTQSLIDYTGPLFYSVSGTDVEGTYQYISAQLPQQYALVTGQWYIRAAQIDGFNRLGLWTSPVQFTVSHAPWASQLSPSGSAIFAYGAGNVTFTWKFQDPYAADTQSAYRVVVETNEAAPVVVVDTGKVTSADGFATVAIPDTAKNEELRWSVQLWDMDDNPGVLSAYELFTVADPPSITPVDPVDAGVVDNARPNIQWQFASALDATQVAYRVYFLSEGVMVYDSTWLNGDAQSFQPPDIILQNEKSYSMVISVRDSAGLDNQVSVAFTTQWDLPADPDLTSLSVDTRFYDAIGGGYVKVTWTNLTTDPDFLSWRLYRRFNLPSSTKDGDKGLEWELIHEEFSVSPPDGGDTYEYLDYSAPSSYDVHYMLTQTAVRFGSIVESNKPDLTDSGKTFNMYAEHYWLILPDADGDQEDVIRIEHATSDSYTDEYEEEVMNLVGRGRHVEKGDRLGYSGTLNMEIRFIEGVYREDDPRRQKIDLERFAAMRTKVWIRSPFGDLFMASTGDMQFDRIAGVGRSEFLNVQLPYREVYE